MNIIVDIDEMHEKAEALRYTGRRIGFVPTMGYFHEGHLSLMRTAKEISDVVVVSLFVNPTQFGEGEDYKTYPRNEQRDRRRAEENGCDIFFIPTVEAMYPRGYVTYVNVEKLTEGLCGASRPDHFRGVTTVVTKLFNIIKPHVAVFGQKDAQQAIVIRRMVKDLNQDIEIVIAPIVREPDGLAMSSRNTYLTEEERKEATVLSQSLDLAKKVIDSGERRAPAILDTMMNLIHSKNSARVDYIAIVDEQNLDPVDVLQGRILIAVAVRFGRARLIDNMVITC